MRKGTVEQGMKMLKVDVLTVIRARLVAGLISQGVTPQEFSYAVSRGMKMMDLAGKFRKELADRQVVTERMSADELRHFGMHEV